MAVHADLRRGDTSETRDFNRKMTIPAVDAKAGDVMIMAKRDRLLAHDPGLRDIRRPLDGEEKPQQRSHEEDGAKDAYPGNRIGTGVKYLGHGQGDLN